MVIFCPLGRWTIEGAMVGVVDDEWKGLYLLRNNHDRVRVFNSSSKKIINVLLTVRLHGVTVG